MKATDVAKIVAERLAALAKVLDVRRFEVVDEKIYEDDDNVWHVPVRPDVSVEERGKYYDELNKAEREIEQDKHVNVLIIPLQPKPGAASGNAA